MSPITLDVDIRYQCDDCGAERAARDIVLADAGEIVAQPCPACGCCFVTARPAIKVLPQPPRQ